MDIFGLLTMVGGLALFLYGMEVLGDGLKKASGGKLEIILEKLTSNKLLAVLLGAGVTAIIQSSSATTVMVVGFVSSGIMSLSRAVGVILGANVGTTITAWILSLAEMSGTGFIFELLKPTSFSPIFAIVGVSILMMSNNEKRKNAATIMIGFAVLMFGMDMMSGAVKPLADVPEFRSLLLKFSNLDAVFRKYDIPYFLSSRKEISEKPLIKLIFSAFSVAERGFRGADVIAYIKTGYTGITSDEVCLFENYIVKWNIRGRTFTGDEPWNMHPRGYGATFTEEDTERLRALADIRERVIGPLKAFAAAGKTVSTVKERATLLFDFLTSLGVPTLLEAKAREAALRDQTALAAETFQLWSVFCGALDQLVTACGQTEASVSEFSQMLSTVLMDTDIGKIPTSVDEVTISGAAQKIPGEHRYVYLVGAEEGKFPMRFSEKGLFSEHEKSQLKSHGVELTDRMERAASEELYYFYRAATLPSEHLHVSFSHYNFSGDEQFPSVGIKRIRALFKGIEIEDFEKTDLRDRIESKKASFEKSAFAGGHLGKALREYYGEDEEYAQKMKYMRYPLGSEDCVLSAESAEVLFPGKLSASYSRLEKFIKCRFAYFCEYELKLRDYEPTSFGAPDIGSFMHGVLEKTVKWIAEGGDGDIGENVKKIAEDYISEIFRMPPELVPKRLSHLFDYLCRSAEIFAKRIKEELEASSFRPRDFELTVGREGDAVEPLRLESGDVSVELRGKIDRVDTYEDGDGKLYVRVVDYKTGSKTFKIENVKLGLDTQMLLYLFSILENGKKRYGSDPIPAAVLYAGIKPPQTEMKIGEDTSAFENKVEASGLFLKDEAVLRAMDPMLKGEYIPVKESDLGKDKPSLIGEGAFADLKKEVTDVILKYASEMKSGVACARPLEVGGATPCEYCKMKAVCRASH